MKDTNKTKEEPWFKGIFEVANNIKYQEQEKNETPSSAKKKMF
jgi:hypothetical protein